MLWILVPLWVSWFFGEFFQEKLGTSFGNAISNAVVVLWAGIDCIRQTLFLMSANAINDPIWIRFALCGALIAYGIIIIVYGAKVKEKVKIFGRIRDVTYAFVMLVPVLYNVQQLTADYLIAMIVFFPIFHYVIELIDLKAPTPNALKEDLGSQKPATKSQEPVQSIPQQQTSQDQGKRPPMMSYWNN